MMTTNNEKLRAYKQGFVAILMEDDIINERDANIIVDLAYKEVTDTQQRLMATADAHLPRGEQRIMFSSVALKMLSDMAAQSMQMLEVVASDDVDAIVDMIMGQAGRAVAGGSEEELDAALRAKGIVVNRETHAVIAHRQVDENCDCEACRRVAELKADPTIQRALMDDGYIAYIVPIDMFEMYKAQATGVTVQ